MYVVLNYLPLKVLAVIGNERTEVESLALSTLPDKGRQNQMSVSYEEVTNNGLHMDIDC